MTSNSIVGSRVERRDQLCLLTIRLIHGCSGVKQRSAVVAERGMRNQLPDPEFWPHSGGYFIPVDIFGTITSHGYFFRFANQIHESPISRNPATAIHTRSDVTLSFTNRVCRKTRQVLFLSRKGGHQSAQLFVIDMFVGSTLQL